MKYFFGKKLTDHFIKVKISSENKEMIKSARNLAKISNLKQNHCFICGSKETKKESMCYGINYLRCLKCNHVYVDRRISDTDITKYYSKNKNYSSITYANKTDLKLREEIVSPKIQFVKKFSKGKNWLDVGSADGSAVSVISKNGFHVQGIEISENSRKFAKKFRNIDLYPKSLAKFFKENKKKWNIISFFGVLEHLPEPMAALKISNRLLVKNGIIVIAVPNYDSISTAVLKSTQVPNRHLIPYSHIMLFSKDSLEYSLTKSGFKPIALWCYGMDAIELFKHIKTHNKIFSNPKINELFKNINELQKIFDSLLRGDEFLIIAKKIQEK